MAECISLSGQWTLRFGPESPDAPATPEALTKCSWQTVAAEVPGNVELDLVRAGLLPPLEVGTNIFALREVETYRWWYAREFAPPKLQPGETLELRFDGIDCLATIWIGDRLVGRTDNALIPHAFDITDCVTAGKPTSIHVRLDSPLLAGRRRIPEAVENVAGLSGRWESLAIRKPPHCYGWDIMPRAVSAGLWRDVTLRVLPATRLRSVYWFTQSVDAETSAASVCVDWDFCTDRLLTDDMTVRASLADDAGAVVATSETPALGTHGRIRFDLDEAKLWWPRGYGAPHLYTARVELLAPNGDVIDRHKCCIGIRTIELDMTPALDDKGDGAFRFVVNGVPVFAKGTNWVPLDAFHSRDRLHYDTVLPMLAELNCNMVRCWGGNVYEDEPFFDYCDAHGIMVWQDFAFACAVYPQDSAFREAVYSEAETIVRRLRNHASLVLWAGNNENDLVQQWKGVDRWQDPNDEAISRTVLAEAVRRNDLTRPYLPSSPYISPELRALGAPVRAMPEDHLWGPRPHFKSPFYAESPALFVSEIGYHGCPCRESLEQMLSPEALWPPEGNAEWDAKSVTWHPARFPDESRIQLMTKQLRYLFDATPDNLDDYILASQITQMEALKFFIERMRLKPGSGGILWWNLRDGWPVISDAAAVDYYNRRKLAFETIRRVQADVSIIVAEPTNGQHALMAVNDSRRAASGSVTLTNAAGNALMEIEFTVGPGERAEIAHLPVEPSNEMWLVRWQLADGATGYNHYLCGPTPMPLKTYRPYLARFCP